MKNAMELFGINDEELIDIANEVCTENPPDYSQYAKDALEFFGLTYEDIDKMISK